MLSPTTCQGALLERAYDQHDEPTDAEILGVLVETFGMSQRRAIERVHTFDVVAALRANPLPDDLPSRHAAQAARAIAAIDEALAIVKSDGHAATFQNIGQYRTSIIATLGDAAFRTTQHIRYMDSVLHLADALINHHRRPTPASTPPNASEVRR